MMNFIGRLPAWALIRLPVRLSRRWAAYSSATICPTAEKNTASQSQLLVDVSVIFQTDARTGIQRVVRALLLHLLETPPIGYSVRPIFATRQHGYRYANNDFLSNKLTVSEGLHSPVHVSNGDIFLGLDLAAHILPLHQAQLLRWKRLGVKFYIFVYDLLPLLHPEWFNHKTVRNFKRWIRWLAVYSDNPICISQTVKTELHTWLNARFRVQYASLSSHTIVLGADIYASAPSTGLPYDSKALLDRLSSASTVLMVGTIEPRKGYEQALSAFEKIWNHSDFSPSLIIVGRPGWKTEALQQKLLNHAEAGRRLFWLKSVSDEYLTQLYGVCKGVLVASSGEGFGLPLIEAISHNKPVLARDIPVFHELNIEGLTYFDDDTPSRLATAIKDWLMSITSSTYSPFLENSKKFLPSWQLSAKQLLKALNLKTLEPKAIENRLNKH